VLTADEIKRIAVDLGVPLPNVEKDYVMGWLIWSVCTIANCVIR
jgi:hypothetical protein